MFLDMLEGGRKIRGDDQGALAANNFVSALVKVFKGFMRDREGLRN